VVWHGDPMEIERHALQIAIQIRLMLWLVLLLAVDHWLQPLGARFKRRSARQPGLKAGAPGLEQN
jgi:hypothetical protein